MARQGEMMEDISEVNIDPDASYENLGHIEKSSLDEFLHHSFEISIEIVACDFMTRVDCAYREL